MQLSEHQLLTLLNYDTNVRQVFSYMQRIELHKAIAIVRDDRRYPDFDVELETAVHSLMRKIKEFGWEREIVRIGQDRLPYIIRESKFN